MTAAGRYLQDSPAAIIDEAARVLARGGVVLFPTDTVYGLLAAADSRPGYRRIFELKHRSPGKPLAVLIGANSIASRSVPELLKEHPAAADSFRQGQLTIIVAPLQLPAAALPDSLQSIQPGNIGMRRPDHPELQALISRCGGCLWATSANAAGEPPPATAGDLEHALATLAGPPDLLVLSRTALPGTPSQIALLRAGELDWLER